MSDFKSSPFCDVKLGPVDVKRTDLADGGFLLESNEVFESYPRCITEKLVYWAEHRPEQTFMAQRVSGGEWQHLSYKDAYDKVQKIGQALLDRGLNSERTVAILSENSLENILLALAALHVGIPYSPISTPYALVSTDFGKLRHCLDLMTPGLIFVSDGQAYEKALNAVLPNMPETEVVVLKNAPISIKTTSFEDLLNTEVTEAVTKAFEAITPDTVAKVLFTSGSTGQPKGVINTHRLWCANLQQIRQNLAFVAEEPPLLVDWLPWNHTFGGNHNTGIALYNGGSLYIDDGKPSPAGIAQTVANLKELSPTVYFNVPKGFETLISYLESDEQLRESFFKNLKLIFYAGAGLAQPVWDKLEELAYQTTGKRVPIITGLGMTESGPSALFAAWPNGFSGLLGIPVAGVKIKLVPNLEKLEVRYKGPNITPGYWRDEALTAKAFDEEGYFLTGDALKFVDENDPNKGMLFDGRVSEDFKLTTGTWVNAGVLRGVLNSAASPLVQDSVIAGQDRGFVSAILFLNSEACKKLIGDASSLSETEVFTHPKVKAELNRILLDLKAKSTGSSNRIERMIVAIEAPSIDLGEITDKGSLNQRGVLKLRTHLVEELYNDEPSEQVLKGE